MTTPKLSITANAKLADAIMDKNRLS